MQARRFRSIRGLIPIIALSAGAACSMPRDPNGTRDRVERTHTLRLGVVQTASFDEPSSKALARILHETRSDPQIVVSDSEDLLERLEKGELDLVYGKFPRSTPWKSAVHFSSTPGYLGPVPKSEPAPRFATMKGENGWIMLIAEATR